MNLQPVYLTDRKYSSVNEISMEPIQFNLGPYIRVPLLYDLVLHLCADHFLILVSKRLFLPAKINLTSGFY